MGAGGTVVATMPPESLEVAATMMPFTAQALPMQGSMTEAWDRVRRRLRAELGEDVFSSWFARVEIATVTDGVAYLTVPTRFLKSWLEAHYAERLQVNCQAELGAANGVVISVRQVSRDMWPRLLGAGDPGARRQAGRRGYGLRGAASGLGPGSLRRELVDACGTLLDRRMTFANFIIGKSNQLAFAAAERIAAAPAGSTPYNPLYLHAGVGLGKTHLLQAIAQEARSQGKRVAYFTADRFMYGFVAALKSQTALAFKEKLRGIDLLVVDDVQFIQGKSIQQEFGHTINALIDAGKQIVVAGDRLANDLEALDERIRSRLGGGLVVEVGDLDEALRAKILGGRLDVLQAAHQNFQVNPDVVAYVARVVATNGRDLDGAANRCSPMRRCRASPSRWRRPRPRSAISSAPASRAASRSRTSRSWSRRATMSAAPISCPSAVPPPWSSRARSRCISPRR
jgi:chromosomal replication initiator protein